MAKAWSDGVDGALVVPSLEAWRETTGLPWFGFWARELLRWGTLEPFVAFSLAEGLVGTRGEGMQLKQEFSTWLEEQKPNLEADDRIDPQLFLEWRRSRTEAPNDRIRRRSIDVELDNTAGERGQYSVIPVVYDNVIHWFDAAGFSLAQSNSEDSPFQGLAHRDDFQLRTDQDQPTVRRTFSGSS